MASRDTIPVRTRPRFPLALLAAALVAAAAPLGGCGQKGPLVLPDAANPPPAAADEDGEGGAQDAEDDRRDGRSGGDGDDG